MGELIHLHDPNNYSLVMARIKRLWKEGYVQIIYHARRREKERELDDLDVNHIINYGKVVEHSCPVKLWRYTIEGLSVDGARACCVVEIDDNNLIVITVFKRNTGGRFKK